jgi:hypothetical protein
MTKVHKLDPNKPRKIAETEWSENGLRLSPAKRLVENDWFLPAIIMFPIGAFMIVFFW